MKISGFKNILDHVEAELKQNPILGQPENLYEPLNYIMGLGGKRVRPVLAVMGYNLFGHDSSKVIPVSLALEVFHNSTLIHDDIMDHAPLRRGMPTVHEKWDTNLAILSGDLMLIRSYKALLQAEQRHWPALLEVFNKTAEEVCQGQQMDMNFETYPVVSEAQYIEMIRLKTAVLLGCSLKTGAIMGDAPDLDAHNLYAFGVGIGMAFQLMDDYLDAFGTPETVGKQPGGDILEGKKTLLHIQAEQVDHYALKAAMAEPVESRVGAVKAVYRSTGADQYLKGLMNRWYSLGIECLDRVQVDRTLKVDLYELAASLMGRAS